MAYKEPPLGANPGICEGRMYPKRQRKKMKQLSAKENHEFSGVCRFGADQLVSCYGQEHNTDEGYSRNDFLDMCKGCQYSLCKGKKKLQGYSVTEPNFIHDEFLSLLDLRASKPKYFLYFISDGEYVKIGITDNIRSRLSSLQTSNARKLEVISLIPVKNSDCAYKLEKNLHLAYDMFHVSGEWYNILGLINVDEFKRHWPAYDYEVY